MGDGRHGPVVVQRAVKGGFYALDRVVAAESSPEFIAWIVETTQEANEYDDRHNRLYG